MTQSEFGKLLASAMQEMGTEETMHHMATFMLCVAERSQKEGYISKEPVNIQTSMGEAMLTTHQAARNMENNQ